MSRPWLAVLLCAILFVQATISAVALSGSGSSVSSSTSTSSKDVEAASQTQGTQTIVQPTNLFKQSPGIGNKGMPAPMNGFKRDLRPFEWLYKHLNDYLMCAYSEHPDCEKNLAKSMELEEAMSYMKKIRIHSMNQHEKNRFQPSMDAVQSNVPITNDFGLVGQMKNPMDQMDKLDKKGPMTFMPPGEFAHKGHEGGPFGPYAGPESKPFGDSRYPAGPGVPVGPGVPFAHIPAGPFALYNRPEMGWPMQGVTDKGPIPDGKYFDGPGMIPYPMMPVPFFMPQQF